MVLAVLASLLGYALLCSRRFGWRPEESLLPVTASIVLLLYLFALAGPLRMGAYAIAIAGWIALILSLWKASRDGRQALTGILTPGIVVFCVAAMLLWLKLRHATYSSWDEFSHWGVMTKWIAAEAALPLSIAAVYLPHYPPGSALWHFFVTRIVPYSEGSAYFAHHLLVLVPFVLVLARLGWRRWITLPVVVLFGYLAVFTFGHGFQSLLIDHVLGAYFGGAILWYVTGDGTRARLMAMAPIVGTLPVWKEGGLLLAGVACAVPAVVEVARYVRSRRAKNAAPAGRLILALVVVPGAAIVANALWVGHVSRQFRNFESKTSTVTVSRVRATLSGRLTERERVVLPKFRDALVQASVGHGRIWSLLNGVTSRAGLRPMVNNGDFSATSLEGWRPYGASDIAIIGERLRVTRGAGADTAAQVMTTIRTRVGRRYLLSCAYELGKAQSAALRVRARINTLAEQTGQLPSGILSVEFVATTTDTDVDLWFLSPLPVGYGYFDDVRVLEIADQPDGRQASTPAAAAAASADQRPTPVIPQPVVVNGDFASGLRGWRPFGTSKLDVVKGRLRATRQGGSDTAAQALTTVRTIPGERYRLSCTYALNTTQSAWLRVRSGPQPLGQVSSTRPSGRLSVAFTATSLDTEIDLWLVSPQPDGFGYFDDVKIVLVESPGRRTTAVEEPKAAAPKALPPRAVAAPADAGALSRMAQPLSERPVPVVLCVAVLVAFGVVLWPVASGRDDRTPIVVATLVLTGGVAVYLLALLSVYLYALSEQDARDLTSFGRYTAVYFLGWALVVFGTAIHLSAGRRRRTAAAGAAGLMLLLLAAAPRASVDWLLDEPTMLADRQAVQAQVEKVRTLVPPNRSVSILWQHTQGFEFWMLRYEMAPRPCNFWNFSFGAPYYPGDVWTSDFSDVRFSSLMARYDYLFMARADAQFWSRYGHLFDASSRGLTSALFRIVPLPYGGAYFELVTKL